MEHTNFYDYMFKRKSVRKYNMVSIDQSMLDKISGHIETLKPMYSDIKVKMSVVLPDTIKNMVPTKIPYYIAVYSEKKEGYLTNAGFMLQQMDLFLSANGIGSCWMGMTKPSKKSQEYKNYEYVIAMAFGMPDEPLYRKNIFEFSRKTIQNISNISGESDMNSIIEAARVAPSAVNGQPWYFKVSDGMIHAYCIKPNVIKAITMKNLNKIDMGIALCHIWTALKHEGKDADFVQDEEAEKNAPSGYYYIASVKAV